MALVVVLDDGDGQDGEVHEGEEGGGGQTGRGTKILFSPPPGLKSPPPTN